MPNAFDQRFDWLKSNCYVFFKQIHILLTWILSIRRLKILISIAHHSCLDIVVVTFLASVKASLKSCNLMPRLNLHKCGVRIKLIVLTFLLCSIFILRATKFQVIAGGAEGWVSGKHHIGSILMMSAFQTELSWV